MSYIIDIRNFKPTHTHVAWAFQRLLDIDPSSIAHTMDTYHNKYRGHGEREIWYNRCTGEWSLHGWRRFDYNWLVKKAAERRPSLPAMIVRINRVVRENYDRERKEITDVSCQTN